MDRLPMTRRLHARLTGALLVSLVLCAGCPPPPPPRCPTCPEAACPKPLLVARNGELYVKDLPVDLPRTAFLYALDPVPLHGEIRPHIGLLHVVDPGSFRVAWFCKPARDLDGPLAAGGVPVVSVKPDFLPRLGGCWARFNPKGPAAGPAAPDADTHLLRLVLDIGSDDGVQSGDVYEVLGPAELDLDSRAGEFPVIGHCTIVKKGLTNIASTCLLDDRSSPAFQDHHWQRGGHVHLLKER